MSVFPLRARPLASYREHPRAFGCPRGSRKHAGCDLYTNAGAEVLSVEDGTVVRGQYLFYDVVNAIEIRHPSGVVRYGEISHAAAGVVAGAKVKAGQVVGYVGKMAGVPQSMLHFEMFAGAAEGPLTDRSRLPFMRREDLLDPAPFLDQCVIWVSV